MQQNYQSTRVAGLGQDVGVGNPPNAVWSDPNGVTGVGNQAAVAFSLGGQKADNLVAKNFGFNIPSFAIIDGITVNITGSVGNGIAGDVSINPAGSVAKDIGVLNQSYGSSTDKWGLSTITPATLNANAFSTIINANDLSGGDGQATVSLVEVTVFWHIDIETAPADVPIRVAYKTYSGSGKYLGELPNVASKFAFSQDENTAGSTIDIVAGVKADNAVTVDPILTQNDDPILTNYDLPILATDTEIVLAEGDSSNDAIFKNGNRIKVWVYNYWHPNGKLMFSGQVNKVSLHYGDGSSGTKLSVISDGLDLNNFIARGYPFAYTTDVSQTNANGYFIVSQGSGKNQAAWNRYGQTWITGASTSNIGAISLLIYGTAVTTVSIYDQVNGNLLGSVTKSVKNATALVTQFEFAQLIKLTPSTTYFVAVSTSAGQSIRIYKNSSSAVYPDGSMYVSNYTGTSGGSYTPVAGDIYFVTKSGTPTTITTYANQDPVSGMAAGILADYNARGGYITPRNLLPTGLSLTYTFNIAFIFDALKKVLELSPTGYYFYVDLGTAEIDILKQSQTADFTVVRGRDVAELDIVLSIEKVKNSLLFTGGPAPTTNLFRQYQDSNSSANYGIRTATQTDNRVTTIATADAIGSTFIQENSQETQETSITIPVTSMDTSLLVPGKTLGFKNYNNFIDSLILKIVRREYNTGYVTLALGVLPVRMNDQIQRINRGLLNEQTSNNPSQPS